MAQSFNDLTVDQSWRDLATIDGYQDVADQQVTLQSKGGQTRILIFFGGAEAPEEDFGIELFTGQAVTGTNAHIWVKGKGALAVLLED